MKSIRTRILVTVCMLVAAAVVLVGGASIFLNNWTTNMVLEQTMTETAKISAERIANQLRVYRTIVEDAGRDSILTDPNATLEQKQGVIDAVCARNADLTRGNILDMSGVSIFTGTDFSDRYYFKQSVQGKTWISDPLVSQVTGAISIIVAAPIMDGNTVTGVIYFVPTETFLDDIVRDIKISPNGGAVILNKEGTVIAHPNQDFVIEEFNSQILEKNDAAYKRVASLEREMAALKIGFGTYSMRGTEKFMAYAPVDGTDGWSMNVNAPTGDFMQYTNTSILVTTVLLVVALIAAALLALSLANGIGKPMKFLAVELAGIASSGKVKLNSDILDTNRRYMQKKDEVGEIANAVNALVDMLTIDADELEAIAGGDLTADVITRSHEDELGNAMLKMVGNLNAMFSNINEASSQVSTGAKQIAEGSHALAQGSTQQAAAVEQLSSSISEIAGKTKENADMAVRAAGLGDTIKVSAEKGSQQMNHMVQAVKEINEASQNIGKVIQVIDNIAFQTNILALNAAVEAARAGQHGKGFAVVAEEVRNLASKSADAARDTGSLIANTMEKAELGARIAEETAASLTEIVTGINESSRIVSEIAKSSEEQTAAITQINKGIDQVAHVVQQNSATAEESAASSEEMSGQANVLEELISQFKIKNSSARLSSRRQTAPEKPISMPERTYTASHSGNEQGFGKY